MTTKFVKAFLTLVWGLFLGSVWLAVPMGARARSIVPFSIREHNAVRAPLADRCYVDADAAGAATGLTWTDAYTTVQDALANVNCTEVWVANGVYYPDEGIGQTNDIATSTFTLRAGLTLYGGFAGWETDLSQRDPANNLTVLSGDLEQNDIVDANGVVTNAANITGTNAFHVIYVHNTFVLSDTVLDGFVVTAGDAQGNGGGDYSLQDGGGMYNAYASPTVSNVTFSGNRASLFGGGVYVEAGTLTLSHVNFQGNSALHGGGVYNDTTMFGNGAPVLSDVTFSDNSADNGGGVYNAFGKTLLTNVTFSNNYALSGGGLYNHYGSYSTPILTNVTFSGNIAEDFGGGMFNDVGSPQLFNVTFSGNRANDGGGFYNASGNPTLINVILANSVGGDCSGNNVSSASSNNLTDDTAHTCGMSDGVNGNIIGENPRLGPLTNYGGPGRQVFPLSGDSPAIDNGADSDCPSADQRGQARPVGFHCDIGAFEMLSLLYVDADAAGSSTGLTWTDAFTNVQDALSTAVTGTQIWVADGVYYPDEGNGQTNDAPTSTFVLKSGVSLYGGFAGDETALNQREPVNNVTVLSGDLEQNDIVNSNGVVTDTNNITGTNAYHVVSSTDVLSDTLLDGFIVTAGDAGGNGTLDTRGGGLYNAQGDPTLSNLVFAGNHAAEGGGVYNTSGNPTLTNVTLSGNSALYGGGIYNTSGNPTLTDITFADNDATWGGGMYSLYGSPALRNATFSDNQAGNNGGGIYSLFENMTLINATLSGNGAAYEGGGIYNYYTTLTLTNVIVANSTSGGDCASDPALNTASNNLIEDASNACGLTNGVNGNLLGQDPKLGPLTDYGGAGRQVFPLLPDSPAINAGTNLACPSADQRGQPRPAGPACDIGAFELSYALRIAKRLDDFTPLPGQTITFTIVVTNPVLTVTDATISDTLPPGLNFVGPVTLENPGGGGTAGSQPPLLASNLTIGNGQRLTVTFPVTVSRGLPAGTWITNTSAVSARQILSPVFATVSLQIQNAAPVADAGSTQVVAPGAFVTLNGSGSNDSNGDALIYRWIQTGGYGVSLSDSAAMSPTFAAPSLPGVLTFTLTVTDSGGLHDSDVTTVIVNQSPVADAGPDQSANTNALVTLDGSGSRDPDEDYPLTYRWTQSGGPPVTLSAPNVVSPTFTALGDPAVLTFTLAVTDSLGLASPTPDTVVVTITNQAPVADAGPDQSANTNALVTLDGSGSRDPDEDYPLTYRWTQSGGPPVTLSAVDVVSPTFVAPSDPAVLTFTLTVTDSLGLAAPTPDTVVVVVREYAVYLPMVQRNIP